MQNLFITYNSCPSCGSNDIHPALTAIDYTVSRKQFEIWECASCTIRFTQHVPDAAAMSDYYQSENYISHTDTSKGLVNRLYHYVRKQTLAGKHKLITSALIKSQHDKPGTKKILDIGAGTGAFVHYMQSHGWDATGLEPDERARQRAASIHEVKLLPAEDLYSIEANSFDAISLWHVLEHVHALHDYLEQLKKILSGNGRIFIAVPNYTSYDASLYKNYWAAYDVPRHLYHFSPVAMKKLLARHSLQLYAIHPMWYDSFYISMLSEKYKTGKSSIVKGFFNGGISNFKAMSNKEHCSSLIYVLGK